MDLQSGVTRQITWDPAGASYPSWSPTGSALAFVTGDVEDQYNSSNQVMLVDPATDQTTVLTTEQQPPYTRSAFAREYLLLVGNALSLVAISTDTLGRYDVVPMTGRIPNPTSPSLAPTGGTYYVFSDYCGSQQLYLARVDGKTGDTCANALPLAHYSAGLIGVSWGPGAFVAAETGDHDIVLVPTDGTDDIRVLVNTAAPERNPAFAPAATNLNCTK